MPVAEVRPVIDMAISIAHAAAAEHGRGAKAATMDRNATAPETATTERGTSAPEAAAMKCRAAAAETTASTSAEATTTSTTTKTTAAAVADFGRETIGCVFY